MEKDIEIFMKDVYEYLKSEKTKTKEMLKAVKGNKIAEYLHQHTIDVYQDLIDIFEDYYKEDKND